MAVTIIAKFRGRCRCGARVLPGARVGYQRRAVVDCVACRPAANPVSTVYRERAGNTESTDCVERAGSAESTILRERAVAE